MTSIREQIREHQVATDTSDSTMLDIFCSFFEETFGGEHPTKTYDLFVDHMVSALEQLPGDISMPIWRSPLFTDEEQDLMVNEKKDEISDCLKDVAIEQLDREDFLDLMGYVIDIEEMVELLDHIGDQDDQVTGQFLRYHADHIGDLEVLSQARRFKLINEEETEITDLGHQFVERYK